MQYTSIWIPTDRMSSIVNNEMEALVLLNGLDRDYESIIVTITQSFHQTAHAEIDVD
jgi:hypothetical protein